MTKAEHKKRILQAAKDLKQISGASIERARFETLVSEIAHIREILDDAIGDEPAPATEPKGRKRS